jgi:hypothetical protein
MPSARSDTSVGRNVLSEGLTVLVKADDIVRYLRQQDDVVVPTADGTYLVNARFLETLDQLVTRANRIRARRKLTQFRLVPDRG